MSEIMVSVVLPCLNEQESVGLCVTESLEAMAAGGLAGEVIVVDNGSTDASVEVATAAGARIVSESRPGYGSALLAGFDAAALGRGGNESDILLELDTLESDRCIARLDTDPKTVSDEAAI